MLNKRLQGATVERVYWAVNVPSWLPVVGENFDSPTAARLYAEDAVSANSPKASIETRIVFRYPENHLLSGTVDIAVATEYADYNVVIARPSYEERY